MPINEGITYLQVNGVIRINNINGQPNIIAKRGTWLSEIDETYRPYERVRYVCRCEPGILLDDEARFKQQVVVELPEWHRDRERRLNEGLSTAVCIDPCIVDPIKNLWRNEIETIGCCCGHEESRAWVQVYPDQYVRMFELGYEQAPVQVTEKGTVMNLYTFYL